MAKRRRSPGSAAKLLEAGNPANPRVISPQALDALRKSMEKYGDLSGVVWNRRTRTLVGGHQRLKNFDGDEGVTIEKRFRRPTATGTVALGYVELEGERWGYRIVDVDRQTETEMMLAANRHGGEWDQVLLARHLEELSKNGTDIETVGWDEDALAAALDPTRAATEIVEDDPPPVPMTAPRSKAGEVYELGPHRVLCGDSTQEGAASAVRATFNTVFTDPLYGVDYTSRVDKKRRKPLGLMRNDDLRGEALADLVRSAVPDATYRFVCCDWHCYSVFESALGKPKAVCVWNKGHFGLGKGYRRQHEFVLFYGTLNRTDLSDVWDFSRVKQYAHPAQKPVALVAKALGDVPAQGVYDPFLGGGTTIIAAEQLGLVCYGVEIEPRWVDVIRQRYANFVKDPQYSPTKELTETP